MTDPEAPSRMYVLALIGIAGVALVAGWFAVYALYRYLASAWL